VRPRPIFAKKPHPQDDLCLLLEDGAPCHRPARSRGLCLPHKNRLQKYGELERFALAPKPRKYDLRLNPAAVEGLCRVLENGRPCANVPRPMGICNRHYQGIWQRPDLKIEDFAIKTEAPVFARRKHLVPGLCVVREITGGTSSPCEEPAETRGLCGRHYARLRTNEALFTQIADPVHKYRVFRVKPDPKEGVCAIIEDDVGCTTPTSHPRHACDLHRKLLRQAHRLNELTDSFLERTDSLERKPAEAIVPGFCILSLNGVPCTNLPRRRGICHRCSWQIKRLGLDFEALALPKTPLVRQSTFERTCDVVKGVCVLVTNGVPCENAAIARGLCKHHYKVLDRRRDGSLARIGLSAEELAGLPDTPHFYFDKNVPIRFANYEVFGTAPDRNSIALVEAVVSRRIRATVSLDCVRALYSHIGHRLSRSPEEGGRGLPNDVAERQAREYAGKLFYGRGGLWNFVPLGNESFRLCTHEGHLPGLSLEDALEISAFAVARRDLGAELFVTADEGILKYGEAVHPEKVVGAYGYVFDNQRRRSPR
jgi:hypothetical protein